jgi:hypothetical protein
LRSVGLCHNRTTSNQEGQILPYKRKKTTRHLQEDNYKLSHWKTSDLKRVMHGKPLKATIKKEPPVCGWLSIGIPVVGFLVNWLLLDARSNSGGDSWGFTGFFLFVGITLLASFGGGMCVLGAFAKNEKHRILPVLGILLSLGPVFWLFAKLK